MEELLINIIYDKLKDYNFYNYNNAKEFKDNNVEVELYQDLEYIERIKIKIGDKFYIVSVEEGVDLWTKN